MCMIILMLMNVMKEKQTIERVKCVHAFELQLFVGTVGFSGKGS